MTTTEKLTNSSLALASAVGSDRHCQPACRIVRDGYHRGTLFCWHDGEWIVTDIENREFVGVIDRLAVVTLKSNDPDAADNGLNQTAIGFDMEAGEWVVDADELDGLREGYGDDLVVLWMQAKPVTVNISICPTELPEPNGCGDTPTPSEVLDALRSFVDRRHPGATIRCLQVGHRQGDGWAAIDGDDEAGARFMEDFWADFN